MLPGRTTSAPARPRASAPAPAPNRAGRAELLQRARRAVLVASRVPSPDPAGALAELDALGDAVRHRDPGLRALLLRLGLVARLAVAADPVGTDPADPVTGTAVIDEQLDRLLALVAEHGLSLFGADAQMLRARRALLDDDDQGALAAVSTALAHLEDPVLVDHAASAVEHHHNVACSRTLAASTLVSLGVHDIAETLLDQVGGAGYERVRLRVSWGLCLERGGRPGGERMRAGAAVAAELRPHAAPEQRPLLRAATVLARDHAPATTTVARHVARQDAAALARERTVPSQHDRLLTQIARARALERAGEVAHAVSLLEKLRACTPRGEAGLVLALCRELARLRMLLAPTRDLPARRARAAADDYTAQLEAELWALQRARVHSLRTDLAHERLRREHGQVAALALADPLTGLPNRRALDRALDEALAATSGTGTGPAIAMVDVDRFKQINDAVSHARGDEVLRGVATALRSSLRAPDLVARYGGDEFVVVLPDTAPADAAAALARAGAAVGALPTAAGRAVTLSVGVVGARRGEGAEEALARADAVMYAVKRTGGDAVWVQECPASAAHPAGAAGSRS
ncbi:GGDEF domain-containing protein [Actinomycetospora cinnamomea]|uniref:Diguanylate cyclase (GGDEF)-like protein n=1 Tax=Actinomycetospora cinnamomea TaxID=663609 RepID=A0A2U1F706_9PSEU|nr:GGDEF domain-containing protein [Actinomycetospora cinnamomea]PVZ07975.1 diguanylate cyclase (GGDEF)-like protein [Actinomycetospora cinnamomea]